MIDVSLAAVSRLRLTHDMVDMCLRHEALMTYVTHFKVFTALFLCLSQIKTQTFTTNIKFYDHFSNASHKSLQKHSEHHNDSLEAQQTL